MKNFLKILFALLIVSTAYADEEVRVEHDNSRLSIFMQPAISFLTSLA